MTKFSFSSASFIRKEQDYLKTHSGAAARQFRADVASVVRLLDDYPLAGAELALLKGTPLEGVRRWVKGNYTFDYEIDVGGEPIVILVRHHAQNDPHLPYDPEDNSENGI